MLPSGGDLRYNWVLVRLAAIDATEMRDLVFDAWRMVVPKRVAAPLEPEFLTEPRHTRYRHGTRLVLCSSDEAATVSETPSRRPREGARARPQRRHLFWVPRHRRLALEFDTPAACNGAVIRMTPMLWDEGLAEPALAGCARRASVASTMQISRWRISSYAAARAESLAQSCGGWPASSRSRRARRFVSSVSHATVSPSLRLSGTDPPAPGSERVLDALEPPLADRDDVEADASARRAPDAPRATPRRPAAPALLLGGDHLERVAAAGAALLLHLDEAELAPAPGDQVELVAARPDVRAEDPPAAQPVPAGGLALGRCPGRGGSSPCVAAAPGTSSGARRTGRAARTTAECPGVM